MTKQLRDTNAKINKEQKQEQATVITETKTTTETRKTFKIEKIPGVMFEHSAILKVVRAKNGVTDPKMKRKIDNPRAQQLDSNLTCKEG